MKDKADQTIIESQGGEVLRDAPIVVPPKRVIVSDDGPSPMEEDERNEGYDATYTWQRKNRDGAWETYALEGYSQGREDLVHALTALDMPMPPGRIFGDVNTLRPWAVRLLWVCSQSLKELFALRVNLKACVELIEEWAEVNVPRDKKAEAVSLALKIHNAQYLHLAVPKPSDRADSGN